MRLLTMRVRVPPPISGWRSLLLAERFRRRVTFGCAWPHVSPMAMPREFVHPFLGYDCRSQGADEFTPLQPRASATIESMMVTSPVGWPDRRAETLTAV